VRRLAGREPGEALSSKAMARRGFLPAGGQN